MQGAVLTSSLATAALLCAGTAIAAPSGLNQGQMIAHYDNHAFVSSGYHKRYKRTYGPPRLFFAAAPKYGPRNPRGTFVFNPRSLHWYAYNASGRLVNSGRASGGAGYCADVRRPCRTPVGRFSVRSKGGPDCVSSKYPLPHGGAKMPYCMFFSSAYAIHGSNNVPNYNASHGCIRVRPAAARWLRHNFIQIGTRVIVKSY